MLKLNVLQLVVNASEFELNLLFCEWYLVKKTPYAGKFVRCAKGMVKLAPAEIFVPFLFPS